MSGDGNLHVLRMLHQTDWEAKRACAPRAHLHLTVVHKPSQSSVPLAEHECSGRAAVSDGFLRSAER